MSAEAVDGTWKKLKVRQENFVLHVQLHRPEVRNAFDPEMIGEITNVFTAVKSDVAYKGLRAVVLRGAGPSFCAGADLEWMKSMVNFSLAENEADSIRLHQMFLAVRECPVPTIAMVHGHAMGGATGLIAACDLSAAVTDTQFCFSEVKLGLAPAVISPFVLEKMNRSQANRYMLTAEVFSAVAAFSSGLVQMQGSIDEVDAQILNWTKQICANGPEAVRATKQLLQTVMLHSDWSARSALTTSVIAKCRVSAEGQEGLNSFLEKRKPSWSKI